MELRIRIFLLVVSAASTIGCAQQAEPTTGSQSDSGKVVDASNMDVADVPGIGVREMSNARRSLEWRRARREIRPAAPLN